ncbi:hypothetical protein [Sulfitobacter sp.]|uniref:hypothetical protein n=1 Tax=Sulfitobacter sp. TaxID=1903071 RepID=UPI003F6A9B27
MSFSSQYIVGVPVLTAAFLGAMEFFGSVIDPGVGIEIHSLTFTNAPRPVIVQDRTVVAEHTLFAGWEAKITIDGKAVCDGRGAWAYAAGHITAPVPFDEWVGEQGCWEKLPKDITMQACAEYKWGDGEEEKACSIGFRKE